MSSAQHTSSACEAPSPAMDPDAKRGSVSIPVLQTETPRHREGPGNLPRPHREGGRRTSRRPRRPGSRWSRLRPCRVPGAVLPPSPCEGQAQRCYNPVSRVLGPVQPKAQAPWVGGRHLIFPPQHPDLSSEQSPSVSPASSYACTCVGSSTWSPFPACTPTWPRPVHPAARRPDFPFTASTGAS